ncbi:MAG: hypothetical protein PHE86_02035 [Candidatus Marinimicrobia bacterium]|nr:hypothetical protein [Candidatus Neomarinimicrobiota bacterium]
MNVTRFLISEHFHTYLGIPYDEEMVPFPNFGTVLIQHQRYLSKKIAFQWGDKYAFTFQEWTSCVRTLSTAILTSEFRTQTPVLLSLSADPVNMLLFHALLDGGIPAVFIPQKKEIETFSLPFTLIEPDKHVIHSPDNTQETLTIAAEKILNCRPKMPEPFYVPPLRLDHPAVYTLLGDVWVEFTHYNLLVSAQSVGKELALFRDGDTLFSTPVRDFADLVIAGLTSFYYGATTHFYTEVDTLRAQKILQEKKTQLLIPDIKRVDIFELSQDALDYPRDMAVLYRDPAILYLPEKLPFPWRFFWTAPVFGGNGFFVKDKKGVCCKGVDIKVKNGENEGQLMLFGHSIPHAVWLPQQGMLETTVNNMLLTPFRVKILDSERNAFKILNVIKDFYDGVSE